jgi:integrase
MGTIVERKRLDGTKAYMAKIIITRDGKVAHRESKTFDRRQAAAGWIGKREEELSQPGALEREARPDPTLSEIIDTYKRENLSEMGDTKSRVLKNIGKHDLGGKRASTITSQDIVAFCADLRRERKPQTVSTYVEHLSEIFKVARPAWGYPLDLTAMHDARIVARKLGYIGTSDQRDRRPTLSELDKLMEHFKRRLYIQPLSAPMQKLMAFAIYSARRQEEIVKMRWDDLDQAGSRILIRDMKHPDEKDGNHVLCSLPKEALDIILSMPQESHVIFDVAADTISRAFTDACKLLGIDDLHFHDLRHDGVSRLFEMGGTIPQVAAVSGHRSWKNLQRYTHIRQTGDKYAGWKWLPEVTLPLERRVSRARGRSRK